MKHVIVSIIVILTLMAAPLGAAMFQEVNIGMDARTLGMGNAFAPLVEGAPAICLNPAGLGKTKKMQAGISYNSWLLDVSLQEVNIAVPLQYGAWGADVVFVNMGSFESLDEYGYSTGSEFTPFTLQLTGAYGVPVFSYYSSLEKNTPTINLMLGFSGKYIITKIDEEMSQALSWDMGFKLDLFEKVSAGVVLKNISLTPSLDLPSSLSIGFAGKIYLDNQNQLTGAISLSQQLSGTVMYNAGVEYAFAKVFFVRMGYEHDPVLKIAEGTYAGFSVGAGMLIQMLQLDYAFIQKGAAGSPQTITLTYKF